MELEEMKRQWSELNTSVTNTETSINDKKSNKMKTAQQQLITQYRVFFTTGSLFTILSYFIFSRFIDNPWIMLGFVLFFFSASIMDYVLQKKVAEIDFNTMSVTEVAKRAISYRRLHHIFQLILIPSAIILLAFLAYEVSDNEYILYGLCVGGVIGLIIGLKQYFQFMDNYKSLIHNN